MKNESTRTFGNATLIETPGGGVRIPNQQPGRAQKRAMVARYKRTAEGRALMAKLQATHRQARLQAAQTQRGFGVTSKAVDRSNAALKHEDTYAVIAQTIDKP